MRKPRGGRGQKAPYETVQVRCPVPIKLEVENLIANYRDSVLPESASRNADSTGLYTNCLKLVFKFIEETNQTDRLHTRNNTNLVRFRDWLQSHIDSDSL